MFFSAVLFTQLRDSIASLLLSALYYTQITPTNDDNEVLKNATDANDGQSLTTQRTQKRSVYVKCKWNDICNTNGKINTLKGTHIN